MVRPFILRGSSELSAVCKPVKEIAQQWFEDYFPSGKEICATCQRAEQYENTALLSQKDWIHVANSKGHGLWVMVGVESLKGIGSAVFGGFTPSLVGEKASGITATALNKILVELPSRLLLMASADDSQDQMQITTGTLPHILTQRASGALMIELTIPDRILLLVGPELASVIIGQSIPKKSMDKLDDPMVKITTKYIELYTCIGKAELDLGTLQTITVGDVIKLNTRMDDLVKVISIDGQTVCKGFLGFHRDHKALQLEQ